MNQKQFFELREKVQNDLKLNFLFLLRKKNQGFTKWQNVTAIAVVVAFVLLGHSFIKCYFNQIWQLNK